MDRGSHLTAKPRVQYCQNPQRVAWNDYKGLRLVVKVYFVTNLYVYSSLSKETIWVPQGHACSAKPLHSYLLQEHCGS